MPHIVDYIEDRLKLIHDKDSLAAIAIAYEDILEEVDRIREMIRLLPESANVNIISAFLVETTVGFEHIKYHIDEFNAASLNLHKTKFFADTDPGDWPD